MFDWYLPANEWPCPECGAVLEGWQGKDGPRLGLVWKEGASAPVGTALDGLEFMRPPGRDLGGRLPDEFTVYAYDENRHRVTLRCQSVAGVWCESRMGSVERLPAVRPV
jgi:hypothetical protein